MQLITFKNLLSPVSAGEFFACASEGRHLHVAGNEQKFAGLFSWDDVNALLGMSGLWSERSMKVAMDGRDLDAAEFCLPGRNRDGQRVMRPDPRLVADAVGRGATIVLDLLETLTPGTAAVSDSLASVIGGVVSCNAYCSWQYHQGFPSHFDNTEVFVLHIAGRKTWQLYEGRFEYPVDSPGFSYSSLPLEHHEQAKGRVVERIELAPGHLLYIPRGQYHDALASSDATLHLSFGVTQPTGLDFMDILIRSLTDDPIFRQSIPRFDDVPGHEQQLRRIADRLHEIITGPDTSAQMRGQQRERALREAAVHIELPARKRRDRYRVCWRGCRMDRIGTGQRLVAGTAQLDLTDSEAAVAKYVLERDFVEPEILRTVFSRSDPTILAAVLQKLAANGLIEAI